MSSPPLDALAGRTAVLATMHGKEAAIGPVLARFTGLHLLVPQDFDSDRFGTFSREVPRAGSALEAARAKIAAGFACVPDATVGLASEGSFGSHPALPFVPLGAELVLLIDRVYGLELAGWHRAPAPYARGQRVTSLEAALALAQQTGFPAQGLIVMAMADGAPAPQLGVYKALESLTALEAAVDRELAARGEAWLETDLRAHRCPPRMRQIRRAALALVRAWRSRCPACDRPGFVPVEALPGLPCGACLSPTALTRAYRRRCDGCGLDNEQPVRRTQADPTYCDHCNP
jgi:hypothetical protein